MISKYGLAYRAYSKWCSKYSAELMSMLTFKEFGRAEQAKKAEIASHYGLPAIDFIEYVNDARTRQLKKFGWFE